MLSYQHIYHAGNFADVQKHAILVALLKQLALKPQKFGVMDTHAGRGLYDLASAEAEKTSEFVQGIAPFWEKRGEKSPLSDYLDIIASFNEDNELRIYPGSAKIAHELMRHGDKLTLIERHPGEFIELQNSFEGTVGVTIQQEDGFKLMIDKAPLPERRGLVLVDPSYEIKTEYTDLPKYLVKALKKGPQGQYMIWYPMLPANGHKQMLTELRKTDIKDMLVSEVILEKNTPGMYGTGIIIINPPFGFEHAADEITQYVAANLPKATGRTYWLNNQKISQETGLVEEPEG